jgi:hypothetical protein
MKKPILIISFIALSVITFAQEKRQEVGIVFQSLDNFGITYNTGTEKSVWRFNTLYISGTNDINQYDSLLYKSGNYGLGLGIGKSFIINISDNFEFRQGPGLFFSYTRSNTDYNYSTINDVDKIYRSNYYRQGINYLFGLNFIIKEKFILGAEILPSISYSIEKKVSIIDSEKEKTNGVSSLNYNLSSSSARLSLAYRF